MDERRAATKHDPKAIAFFGTWTIFGLYLDGWAHNNEKPETFFSPWHGVLYSGFTAAVIYFAFREYILKKKSNIDDKLAAWGLGIFVAGAVGDGIWHEIFGIEVDLEALLSPTHLMLLTGGLLMLSIGARLAAAEPTGRDTDFKSFFPTLASFTLTAALAMFFTQYFAAHRFGGLVSDGFLEEVHILGSVFTTNAILLAPVLFALRRWNVPFGSFTILFAVVATAIQGLDEFVFWMHIPAAVMAGLVADVLAARLRPSPERRTPALVFSALVPFVTWSLWTAAIHLTNGVALAAELWTGTIYMAVLEGLGLGVLVFSRSPGNATSAAGDPAVSEDRLRVST